MTSVEVDVLVLTILVNCECLPSAVDGRLCVGVSIGEKEGGEASGVVKRESSAIDEKVEDGIYL